MSFFSRAATAAAVVIGLVCAATSSPGFAQQLTPGFNALTATAVPAVEMIVSPAAQQQTTSDSQQPAASATPSSTDFATLEAAVAHQGTPESVSDALHCLAASVYYESKGEPLAGQLAVAEVILNRAKSGRFPPSVCSVVTQPGQFSFIKAGRVPDVGDCAQWRTAVAVAQVALTKAWDSPAVGALYFHARRVAPGWRVIKVAAIGNHVFFR